MKDDYFTEMYAADPDPWGFESRWYEARKHALTVAALPRSRYRNGFEPGCANGALTSLLQPRCQELLAWDIVPAAVERARERLAGTGVRVERGNVRRRWPSETFDLIVVSELIYYLAEDEAAAFARLAAAHLARDGHLVGVHWRHPVAEYPLTGDRAHEILRECSGLQPLGGYADADLVLTVLGHDTTSVAAAEGLVVG